MKRSAKLIVALGVAALIGLVAACWGDGPTPPDRDRLSLTLVLSDTSFAAAGATLASGSATSLASVSEPEVAYISLPPGSVPDGESAVISNRRTRWSVSILLVAGGFDPVSIVASAGDTLETIVSRRDGDPMSLMSVVPKRRRPTIVRTVPPRGKTDVPLNLRTTIVFSEPLDAQTITSASVRLLRDGGPLVAGHLEFADSETLEVAFVPDAPLIANSVYRLVVSQDIRDRDGDVLDTAVTVEFTTTEGPLPTPTEREPNNTPETATPASVEDSIVGTLSHETDTDYFAVELTVGTVVQFTVNRVRPTSGWPLSLELLQPDGVTSLVRNEYPFGPNFVRFPVPASGRYLLRVMPGEIATLYTIRYHTLPPGPGDPPTIFAEGVSGAMAAGPKGELYVLARRQTDEPDVGLLRIDLDGRITPIVVSNTFYLMGGLVVDGFGNLLVTGEECGGPCAGKSFQSFSGPGRVLRIRPDGDVSVFTEGGSPRGITVGPDGDVWLGDEAPVNGFYTGAIKRYSPFGQLRDSMTLGLSGGLAFSPDGGLHAVGPIQVGPNRGLTAVFRLIGGQFEPVGATPNHGVEIGSIAFDQTGVLYATGGWGLKRYNTQGQLIEPTYTSAPQEAGSSILFGRNSDGTMSSRLFFIGYDDTRIFEANRNGDRAVGHRVGVDFVPFEKTQLAAAAVDIPYTDTLRVTGGMTWTVVAGALPEGLTLGAQSGIIAGTPSRDGSFEFTVRADGGGRYALWPFRLVVGAR